MDTRPPASLTWLEATLLVCDRADPTLATELVEAMLAVDGLV